MTTLQTEELKWGETTTVGGGTVTVEAPVIDSDAQSPHPGSAVVYSMVTIVNAGETAISYSPDDFSLEASSSGGTGVSTEPSGVGLSDLGSGTLSSGQSARGIVRFNIKEDDTPVLIWLIVPWSKQVRINWR